jgi:hypothetical protein
MSKIKSKTQVEEAIQCIEARYAIGKEILKECGQRSPRGLITELAEKHGVPRDTCQKAPSTVAGLRSKTVLDTSTQQDSGSDLGVLVLFVMYSNGGQDVTRWSKSGARAAFRDPIRRQAGPQWISVVQRDG